MMRPVCRSAQVMLSHGLRDRATRELERTDRSNVPRLPTNAHTQESRYRATKLVFLDKRCAVLGTSDAAMVKCHCIRRGERRNGSTVSKTDLLPINIIRASSSQPSWFASRGLTNQKMMFLRGLIRGRTVRTRDQTALEQITRCSIVS